MFERKMRGLWGMLSRKGVPKEVEPVEGLIDFKVSRCFQ
jgi:hypothetical protein